MLQFKLTNILTITMFISLFLTFGYASAQYSFDDWDSNDDNLIEYEEFDQVLTDTDYYSDWDTDEDGVLTEDEWSDGIGTWGDYAENVDVEFSDWDLNNDNEITEDEFGEGFFDTLDDDDNDTIDQDEWDLFDSEVDIDNLF